MRLIRLAALAGVANLLSTVLCLAVAFAPTQQERARCLKHAGDKSPDLRISGCTAAILSGRITGHDLALALIGRGDAYTAKGNYDQAIADYNRAIMLDPKHAPAYKSLGYAYYAKRDYDRAIVDYNRAIMLDPKDASAYEGRAGVYYANGNNDQAIADYNQAITLFPRYVGAYFERGGAYGAKKDYAHAIADYTQTIRLDPKNAPAYNNRCRTRALAGRDLQGALADCNQALQLTPNVDYVFNNRGLVHFKLGAYDAAIADYSAAIMLSHEDAGSLYARGVAKLKKGDTANGNADIAAAKAMKSDVVEVYAGYGVN